MNLRSLRTAFAVGIAAAVAVVAPADAAMAACPYDWACLHSGANFSGYHYNSYYSQPNLGNLRYAGTQIPLYAGDHVPSNVSSFENNDPDSPVAVYYNSSYRGPCFTISAGGGYSNFAVIPLSNGLTANDNMNSFHFNQYC